MSAPPPNETIIALAISKISLIFFSQLIAVAEVSTAIHCGAAAVNVCITCIQSQ